MNALQFAGRCECLPIRCPGRLISLENEHPILVRSNDDVKAYVNIL
jgi:hypothetical protein